MVRRKGNNRDDFTQQTKNSLALRASYLCSFTSCSIQTVGPSDESTTAVTIIGVAAHISAAAPGGKRYDLRMSSDERRNILNGIWLCANHATQIDRDETTYTVSKLTEMKKLHEVNCAEKLKAPTVDKNSATELFAIGPSIVGIGSLLEVQSRKWVFEIQHFIMGDIWYTADFLSKFEQIRSSDKFVISNILGDGRVLTAAPVLSSSNHGYKLECNVESPTDRVDVNLLGSGIALSPGGDFTIQNGGLKMVSGLEALRQRVCLQLSRQQGDSPLDQSAGARLRDYYNEFLDSKWINSLLKIDVIRLASIPCMDNSTKQFHTPLSCINRVNTVNIVSSEVDSLLFKLELDVNGAGMISQYVRIIL